MERKKNIFCLPDGTEKKNLELFYILYNLFRKASHIVQAPKVLSEILDVKEKYKGKKIFQMQRIGIRKKEKEKALQKILNCYAYV